jgi:hypothetical protein
MASRCRNTPSPVARQLRQEANFGCARCGCPVLDNAHIIPYEKTHAFPVEDMLALCPTCHRIADDGDYSKEHLRMLKANPYNKIHVKEAFLIEGSDLIVNIDNSVQFKNTPRVLTITDFDIISIKKIDIGYLSLDINFFDKFNSLIGIILDNKWAIDTTLLWDLEYKPQHLIIRNAPRSIVFEVRIEKGEVFLNATMYFKGNQFTMDNNGIWCHEKNIRISGLSFVGFPGGISIQI